MIAYYLILFATGFLILYAYRAVHLVTKKLPKFSRRVIRIVFLLLAVLVYASTSYIAVNFETYQDNKSLTNYAVVGAITLSVTLLVICVIQMISDLVLLARYLRFQIRTKAKSDNRTSISRGTFISQAALALGSVVLGSFLWGTTKGKYGWRIIKNKMSFPNLPKAFDGLKIVQISDLHLGSFNENFKPLEEAVQMINELEPDYIFFTGDLVNEKYTEAEPWIDIFSKLESKRGKYAILGNHDYGWGDKISDEEKATNSKGVADINEKMGFKMLLNQHEILEKDGDKIGLVGVENWGYSKENWFPTEGDYGKSVEGMEEVPFTILLSHDPTHWDHHIVGKEKVDFTLSGHTHGGQMGISIPGLFELSAAKLFYKRYAGLYSEGLQHLYVNRGLGFLIFPGRVGMPPEISFHELRRS
ncbi:MAG: phosphoesterase [Bacteroidetes bacterium]|nr:MAG: phosphoesterase [Bacteroidota bacterium]